MPATNYGRLFIPFHFLYHSGSIPSIHSPIVEVSSKRPSRMASSFARKTAAALSRSRPMALAQLVFEALWDRAGGRCARR